MNSYNTNVLNSQTKLQMQPWVLPTNIHSTETISKRLRDVAGQFTPITLEEMDSVALLDRTDTKYVIPVGKLAVTLSNLSGDYRVLEINHQRFNHYRTLYFDTPGFALFNMHVNGRVDRYKVRSREYTDSHLSFFEVKRKLHNDRTVKNRVRTDQPILDVDEENKQWLSKVYPFETSELEPKIWNTFSRITLVNKERCERVTIDVDISFFTANQVARLDGIAIAEVKMDSQVRKSPFMVQMHLLHIPTNSFSKYCLGASMIYDNIKKNALKPKMLWIEKMSKGEIQ